MSPAGSETPTHTLADFFTGFTLAQTPEEIRDRVKRILLDGFACALAADFSEETTMMSNAAAALGLDGASTVLGARDRRSIAGATLLNGFRITAMTACDVYRPAHCHMTPEVIPPALAVAEQASASGEDLLTALVVGLETAVRVARGMATEEFRARRWHAPGVVGPFGGAAAAAWLLDLDVMGMRNAMAIAGSQAAGTYVAHGTPTVKFHQARGALSGLLGALLAKEGLKGAAEVLAGEDGGLMKTYAGGGDPAAVTDGLGDDWELAEISLRLWPGGTYVQPPLTAAQHLIETTPVAWDRITKVRVRVAPSVKASQSKYSRPRGTFECLASVEYTVGAMLRWHEVSLSHFMSPIYDDVGQRAFVEERIEMVSDDGITPLGSALEVDLDDGSTLTSETRIPKGHPEDWLSWEELASKAHDFGDEVLTATRVDQIVDRMSRLENEASVGELLALVRGD